MHQRVDRQQFSERFPRPGLKVVHQFFRAALKRVTFLIYLQLRLSLINVVTYVVLIIKFPVYSEIIISEYYRHKKRGMMEI